jgi:hypothetical protein
MKKMMLNVHFQEQLVLEIFNFMKLVDSRLPTIRKFYEYYD